MLSAVYRYGAPRTVQSLAAILEEDQQQARWQVYIADTACMLVKCWHNKSKMPYYSELIKKEHQQKDTRTGREILESIILNRKRKKGQHKVLEVKTDETV